MSHVHVCLVSDQPIPNLTTIMQFKPDVCVFLTTAEMRNQTKRLQQVLKGMTIKIEEILPYDMQNVIAVCERIILDCKECDLSLNITGGTKVSTLGAFQAFYTNGKPIYYVNTRGAEILQLSPEEGQKQISVTIPISHYLCLYGFNIEPYHKDGDGISKRRPATEALAELAMERPDLIGRLNYELREDPQYATFPLILNAPREKAIIAALDISAKCLNLKKSGVTVYSISDYDAIRYLRGIWLEEYVYLNAKETGASEVRISVKGKWDAPGKNVPKNEFDVLIAKGIKLFFISCKTANPDRKLSESAEESVSKEYLYELDSLSDRALGLFGKKMLVSARPIKDEYVRKRADVLGISIIDGKNLRNIKENLRQWISK